MEKETVSVWFLSFLSGLHWFIQPQSSYPQWDRNDVPPHVIQTLATVSLAKSEDFPSCFEGEERFCRLLYITDCLNKHFLWQCCDKQRASLHILSYIWLNITQTSGWFSFPELFHLQPVWETPYSPTELSYETFPFFEVTRKSRAWTPGSFTCTYSYFDVF